MPKTRASGRNREGDIVPWEMEDPEHVDERRSDKLVAGFAELTNCRRSPQKTRGPCATKKQGVIGTFHGAPQSVCARWPSSFPFPTRAAARAAKISKDGLRGYEEWLRKTGWRK